MLLRYVVEHTLDGRLESLKERIIGQAVFDRDVGYDTNQDAVVRNAAAEVRKRLAQYYQEADSAGDTYRIEMPSGSYVPEFHPVAVPVQPVAGVALGLAATPGRRAGWPTALLAAVAVIAIAGWIVTARGVLRPAPMELDQFWASHLAATAPVQICVGQSRFSYYAGHVTEDQQNVQVPLSSLQPMRDRFLWFGDSIGMASISGYFSQHHKPFKIRGALVTPYGELRGNPSVLIGAFNNEWTLRLTEGMRFSLSTGASPDVRGVIDHQRGTGLTWTVARSPQGWIADEDYALVTRFLDPHTEQMVVSAGGITHFGTWAAGDFLSNPVYFREALKTAPPDWRKKNIQIVLRIKVVEGTPGPPQVVAAHFW